MYIVVLPVVYRCSACDMSLFCLRYVIGHRTPSDWIASAVRSDCVRRPMISVELLLYANRSEKCRYVT